MPKKRPHSIISSVGRGCGTCLHVREVGEVSLQQRDDAGIRFDRKEFLRVLRHSRNGRLEPPRLLQQLAHPQCKVSLRSGGQEWSTTLTEQGCSPPPAADPPPVQGQSAQWRSRVEHNTHRAGLLRSQMSLSSWKASTKHRAVRARGGSLLPRVESSRASPPHSPQTAGG
jgi:hypothetical protein